MSENDLNFARYGCHHVALGRVLRGHHTAALEDPSMDHPAANIEPVHHVIEGARAYAGLKGLADPHEGIDYHKVRTNRDLIGSLGHAYDALPNHDPSAVKHFHAMRDEVHQQYDHMTKNMGIKAHFVDHDPYRDVNELAHDVRNNHQISVLKTAVTGGHPLFSDEDNDKFRAVHDLFGHLGTGRDFDRHGEEAAYQAHARMFTPHARGALASETRGQNGSLIVNSSFGPQKIALMPKHLWHPGLASQGSVVEDFRRAQHDQWLRSETYSGGNDAERREFFDPNNRGEKKLNLRDWLQVNKTDKHPDEDAHTREYSKGYNLGRLHGDTGRVDAGELNEHSSRSPHPEHFGQGYEVGLEHALDAQETHSTRVAVHQGFSGKTASAAAPESVDSFRVVAHVSGNSIDVLHCPFCGSGAVIARSDGTIECFSGETRYMTFEGVKTFAETAGTTQKVLTSGVAGGDWVDAHISEFGERELLKVTIKRNQRVKEIYATSGHRWFAYNGHGGLKQELTTVDLRPGMALASVLPTSRISRSFPSPFGIAHGVVYGDGARSFKQSQVQLWGEKDAQLLQYFIGHSNSPIKLEDSGLVGVQVRGLPGFFKDRPSLDEATPYLYGWLAGYFAADGSVSRVGQAKLASADKTNLEFVQQVCLRLGIATYGITTSNRLGRSGKRMAEIPTDIFYLELIGSTLRPEFFLIGEHRARFETKVARGGAERLRWTIESIETTDRVETVYCAEVPITQAFALEDNILVGNCNYCTSVFTVQVQPQYPAFPMTTQGQPYAWPGQPDPATVVTPGGAPMMPGDPMATGAGGAPGDIAAPGQPGFSGTGPTDGTDGGGNPFAQEGGDDESGDEDSEPTAQIGGKSAPPFGGKSKGKDDGKKKGDNPFAKKTYLTATGAVLDEEDYLRHLAVAYAGVRPEQIRETR